MAVAAEGGFLVEAVSVWWFWRQAEAFVGEEGVQGGGFAHHESGARFSFGARPIYGRPGSSDRAARSIARQRGQNTSAQAAARSRHRNGNRTGQTSRSLPGQTDQRPVRRKRLTSLSARRVIGSVWDRRGAISGMAIGGAMTGTAW